MYINPVLVDSEVTTPLLRPLVERTLTVCRHFGQNDDNLGLHVFFLVNFCHTKPLKSRFKKRLEAALLCLAY